MFGVISLHLQVDFSFFERGKRVAKKEQPLRPLVTRWGKEIDKNCPLPQYPRPQLRREGWQNLNGTWQYAILDHKEQTPPPSYEGEILVPYSPESLLSGVQRQLQPGQALWYRRTVALEKQKERRILLHFGAVDQRCAVFWNGEKIGAHIGGYWPFTLDITQVAREGENTLEVYVSDDSDFSKGGYGKQKLRRGGIWYTAQSGIWQTVWLEHPPLHYVQALRITPLYDEGQVEVTVIPDGEGARETRIEVLDGDTPVAAQEGEVGVPLRLPIQHFKSWSPDSPFLYGLRVTLGQDEICSYFGMRKFSIEEDASGIKRLMLNNAPLFHTGLLDQGYWSDGMYTPPADEAMIWDITEAKRMGFNMLRKHIKIEPLRWYYHCDRLGMLVWQDFVSGGGPFSSFVVQLLPFIGMRLRDDKYAAFGRADEEGRTRFEEEGHETIHLLYNTPSLAVWVPFNEGWGQFDAARVADEVRALDPTRPIDHASGWHDQEAGDFASEHVYYRKYRFRKDKLGRAAILSEFGGYSCPTEGHVQSDKLFGYKMFKTREKLTEAVSELYRWEVLPTVPRGLCAAVYTQVSDVEDEINGVFTADREVVKLDTEVMYEVNAQLLLAGGDGRTSIDNG